MTLIFCRQGNTPAPVTTIRRKEICFVQNWYFKQSINQSNFYSANIPGVARLSGATARSVFKCEVIEVVP